MSVTFPFRNHKKIVRSRQVSTRQPQTFLTKDDEVEYWKGQYTAAVAEQQDEPQEKDRSNADKSSMYVVLSVSLWNVCWILCLIAFFTFVAMVMLAQIKVNIIAHLDGLCQRANLDPDEKNKCRVMRAMLEIFFS